MEHYGNYNNFGSVILSSNVEKGVISKIEGLEDLVGLNTLNLSKIYDNSGENSISRIEGLEKLEKLTKLSLSNIILIQATTRSAGLRG